MKTTTTLLLTLTIILTSACGVGGAKGLFEQAMALEKEGKHAEALLMYEQLVREHPKSDEAPEALYQSAVLYYNIQKDPLKAATTYELVYDTYPESGIAHKGLFAAGFTYANEIGNIERARQAYERYLKIFPDSSMAETARFELEHLGQTPEQILENLQRNAPPEPVAEEGQ
jgi:TolA-binding protein